MKRMIYLLLAALLLALPALAEGGAPHEAAMSIGTLTTLLLGYKRASELAKLERITASDAALRLLDNALIAEKPCISDYI